MTNTKKRTPQEQDTSKLEEILNNISWKKVLVIVFGVLMMVLWPISMVTNI